MTLPLSTLRSSRDLSPYRMRIRLDGEVDAARAVEPGDVSAAALPGRRCLKDCGGVW
jgi:hypothetical protein